MSDKREFLYWDEEKLESSVRGYLGTAPDKKSDKKSGLKLGSRVERLYRVFSKLSSKEKQKFIKLIEHEL